VSVRPTQEAATIRIQLPQAEIVLMAHRGRAHNDIAADLGIHRVGVTRRLNACCESGLQGRLRSSIGPNRVR